MPKFVEAPEFTKDLNKLRKFRTIEEDLEVFKKALAVDPKNLPGVVIISGIGRGFLPVYKARKFRCRYLQSTGKIRVIYTYNAPTDEITLIEIYFKGQNENHNPDRIKKYAIKIQ